MFDVTVNVKEIFSQNANNEDIFIWGRSASREKRELRSRRKKKPRRRKCKRKNRRRCRKGRNKKGKKTGGGKKKSKLNKKDKKQKTQGRAPDSLMLNVCTRLVYKSLVHCLGGWGGGGFEAKAPPFNFSFHTFTLPYTP